MLMELSIKPTEEQIKHVEEKAAVAIAHAKELWEAMKAVEDKTRPAIQEYELARHQWYEAHTEADALNRLAKSLKELARL